MKNIRPRIHIFQHIPADGPTMIADWMKERGLDARIVRFDLGQDAPDAGEIEALVVLGGTMNVDMEREFSWLRAEKRVIESTLRADKPILGVCLGGQLMAQVLGAKVTRNRGWEIGWHPVELLDERRSLRFFHWHEDTFEIPGGARRFARSAGCANQGFTYGARAVGLQFHPEVDLAWVEASLRETVLPTARPGLDLIQSPEEMLSCAAFAVPQARRYLFDLLDLWFGEPPR